MGRLAGAVIALDHHPAVVLEARENGQRHLFVEEVIGINIRDVFVGLRIARNLEIRIDTKDLPDRKFEVRKRGFAGFATRLL